ncbi:MAG: hypothetical protein IPJ77_02075 [Planctomycetes bacterium]|nr:hypothetical protein [Planctomycetota bacterium]
MDIAGDSESDSTPRPSLALGRRYRAWTIALCGLVLVEQAFELELELHGGFLLFGLVLLVGLLVLLAHGAVALAGVNRALYAWTGGHPEASRAPSTSVSPPRRVLVCLALAAAPWGAWCASQAVCLPGLGYLLLHHKALTAVVDAPGVHDGGFEAVKREDGTVTIFLGTHRIMDAYVLLHAPGPEFSERQDGTRHLIGPWHLADWRF